MTIEGKYEIALKALRNIAAFDHAMNCTSFAPVHECGCRDEYERAIAQNALNELNEG